MAPNLYIYIDESGDFGFSGKGSRYFILGAIVTRNNKCVERIPHKIRKKFLKKKKRDIPELKSNKSSKNIRKKVIEELIKCGDITVLYIYIDKRKTFNYIRKTPSYKAYHYNYLIKQLLSLIPKEFFYYHNKLIIIMDSYFNKRIRRQRLENYIKKFLKYIKEVKIYQIDSRVNNGLQVVDFVTHAFFRYKERNDPYIYNILKNASNINVIERQIY